MEERTSEKRSTADECDFWRNRPKRLKMLAFTTKMDSSDNTLLQDFVLKNSYPNTNSSGKYISGVLRSMASDLPVNELNREGFTALHLAILKRNGLMVERLVHCIKNLDLNVHAENGIFDDTPLHLAVKSGQSEVVKILLSGGAYVNVTAGLWDETPLHSAARTHFTDIVEVLLSAGARVNARDLAECIPLHYAAKTGNLSIIEILVKRCYVNAQDIISETALHGAVFYGHVEIVRELLSKGASVHLADMNGDTPLHIAAKTGRLEIVKSLVSAGSVINAVNKKNETALFCAFQLGHHKIVEELLLNGASRTELGASFWY